MLGYIVTKLNDNITNITKQVIYVNSSFVKANDKWLRYILIFAENGYPPIQNNNIFKDMFEQIKYLKRGVIKDLNVDLVVKIEQRTVYNEEQ